MGVVIRSVKTKKGMSHRVYWNRRREDEPRSVYLGTFPEKVYAEARQDAVRLMLARGEEVSFAILERRTLNTVRELAKTWLASEHSGESAMKTKRIYAAKIVERWGDRSPDRLTKRDVQEWIDEMVRPPKPLGRGTINNHLNVLRPMLRSVEIDPVWLRGTKHLNIPHEDWEAMDLPDQRRREACRAQLAAERQAIFDIIEHGGLRPAEACGLTWNQVGTFEGQPALLNVGTKFVRKGGKPPRSVRWMPELGQPMWVPERPADAAGTARVFSARHTVKSFGPALDRACAAAGIERFIPYSLRHLHATRLMHHQAKHALGLHGMAKRMGHDQAVFLKTYSDHPLPDPE